MSKQLLKAPLPFKSVVKPKDIVTVSILDAMDSMQRWSEQVSRVINNLVSNIPSDSTAADVAGVVTDLNALQDSLRNLNVR